MDDEHCYRAAQSRDGRFDGTFVTAVLTTGIYCRPSCPAMTPQRRNVRFYPTPAAAQDAGFRACKRCRPDAAPGSPEWDSRADLVARAVRLIGDGVIEREGVEGLAARVGYTSRQLHRLLTAELGSGALRLAMAHRIQHARALLDNTDLPITEVALAAGFGSIRQFNDRFREVFALTPTEVRARVRAPGAKTSAPAAAPAPAGLTGQTITAHLTYRPPMDLELTLPFLGQRAVAGIETWDGVRYTCLLDLPCGPGLATIPVQNGQKRGSHPTVTCHLVLSDVRDYSTAIARLRRLLDLDADPVAVAAALGDDPLLAPAVAANPGIRVPGSLNAFEIAVRAVVGQQVSVGAARRLMAIIVERHGTLVGDGADPARLFPTPAALAGADPASLPLPARRAATLTALAAEVDSGRLVLDAGADRDRVARQLVELPGIGPWTASYIRMRGLGDPDVFLTGDLVADRVIADRVGGDRVAPGAYPERWKPWRSYAVVHLWNLAGQTVQADPVRPVQPAADRDRNHRTAKKARTNL